MKNIKYIKSQRLREFMDFYGITQSELSQKVEYPREMINRVYNDKQDVSKNLLKKVTETYTSLSADWIINGTGQMLKSAFFYIFSDWKIIQFYFF